MATPLESAILATSPQTYWKLDDPTGPAASDDSGNGHFGTYNGVPQFGLPGVPGGQDTAISFFPQSNITPHNVQSGAGGVDFGEITINFFFRIFVSTFAASEVMASSLWGGSTGWAFQWQSADSLLHFLTRHDSTFSDFACPQPAARLNDNLWHMATMKRSNAFGTVAGFIDGAQLVSGTTGGTITGVAATGGVGCLFVTGGNIQPFTAEVAHFATWNTLIPNIDILNIWNAAGAQAATIGGTQQQVQQAADPTAYVLGTPVAGLTGSGTIAVPNLYGARVQLTTVPATWGKTYQTPTGYVPAPGGVWFSDLNGDNGPHYVHNPTQLVFAENRTNLFLRYSFRGGIVATITPITLP